MEYQMSFGRPLRAPRAAAGGQRFRLALLGDFSGRASRGLVETGAALAARKPIKVDVDTLDSVLARLCPTLTLALGDEGTVAIPLGSLDDFHPDQLAENLEIFATLRALRRDLGGRGFERAAKQVLSWGGAEKLPAPPRRARGTDVAQARLSDFARLIGRPAEAAPEASADELVRRLVGPFIEPASDTRQDALIGRVDEALSAAMRRILHHPDFQAAEALWRGVEFLVRRLETGERLQIVLCDVSAEELAADLAASDALDSSGLYGMLVEQPALDADQGPLSAIVGLYGFELAPPHAELLGRIARIAAAGGVPFLGAIAPDALATPIHEQHPLIRAAFTALREMPEAAYLGLAAPRFLLRLPYGKSDPIDAFAFEEFTRQEGLGGLLWGHPALIPALLLAEGFLRQGAKMKLGGMMGVSDMPYVVMKDTDGEPIALPCTERLYTERQAVAVGRYGVMPLLSIRGRPEIRLGGFTALTGSALAGFWAPVVIAPRGASAAEVSAPAPEPVASAEPLAESEPEPDASAEEAKSEPGAQAEPEPPAEPEPAADDLDALLASLNAPEPEVAADETEPDLDALLASLQ